MCAHVFTEFSSVLWSHFSIFEELPSIRSWLEAIKKVLELFLDFSSQLIHSWLKAVSALLSKWSHFYLTNLLALTMLAYQEKMRSFSLVRTTYWPTGLLNSNSCVWKFSQFSQTFFVQLKADLTDSHAKGRWGQLHAMVGWGGWQPRSQGLSLALPPS